MWMYLKMLKGQIWKSVVPRRALNISVKHLNSRSNHSVSNKMKLLQLLRFFIYSFERMNYLV